MTQKLIGRVMVIMTLIFSCTISKAQVGCQHGTNFCNIVATYVGGQNTQSAYAYFAAAGPAVVGGASIGQSITLGLSPLWDQNAQLPITAGIASNGTSLTVFRPTRPLAETLRAMINFTGPNACVVGTDDGVENSECATINSAGFSVWVQFFDGQVWSSDATQNPGGTEVFGAATLTSCSTKACDIGFAFDAYTDPIQLPYALIVASNVKVGIQ